MNYTINCMYLDKTVIIEFAHVIYCDNNAFIGKNNRIIIMLT